ncbi:MAG: chemotaxis protein CheW [Bacteroidales bacterium]|nr:chemotaxis protein CheW [Bacteroidales bacterium]
MENVNKTILSFQINENVFAVDALQVAHILEIPSIITKVPNTPDHLVGIINLHGNIIPVVDMRIIMAEEIGESNADNAIIVINPAEIQDSRFGIMVDLVKEVLEINSNDLKETILEGRKGMIENFEGTLLQNDTFIHIIDINHLAEIIEK